MAELRAAIKDADAAGVRRFEIIAETGVARQTVYDSIKGA
jgi:hypothetical protein